MMADVQVRGIDGVAAGAVAAERGGGRPAGPQCRHGRRSSRGEAGQAAGAGRDGGIAGQHQGAAGTAQQREQRRAVAYANAKIWYARFVEYGTRFAQARSFLRAALDESALKSTPR
jgi:hypothetical protein